MTASREWTKRLFDVAVSLSFLVALSPLFLLCGFAVWLSGGRPVLFRQERVGRQGQRFRILKFRTMRPGAGGQVTVAGDPRVTDAGRVLRVLKLDELPQLWNVLAGDMSLVGPRPEVPAYVAAHAAVFGRLAALRPGVTDWASLAFRDEERILRVHRGEQGFYEGVLLPRKLALARLYRSRRSFVLDLGLLLATALAVVGLQSIAYAVAGRKLMRRARAGLAPVSGRDGEEST